MHDDDALLRSYVEDHSDEAFAQLVQRHLPLVYNVALRRVGGDAHLAQDVAQKVFLQLAQKAPSLRKHASLSGWLYISAQHESADLVRREQRRKHRETAAYTMHLENAPSDSDADPANLRPVLDDAIVTLQGDERDAIILRFFEKRTFSEIGAVLRVTDEAARKRVDRALEKLHAALARRGITSTTAALGLALSATATGNIPAGLAAQISTVALAHATAATSSVLATVTSLVVPTAALVALGTWLILPQHRANQTMTAEIGQLSQQADQRSAIRAETVQLAHALSIARDLQRAQVEHAVANATIAASPPQPTKTISNSINLTSEGTIAWEGKPVTLDRYLENLKALHTTAPGGESKLLIRAKSVRTGQLVYVIDEARKAGIKHILVDSDATPETWAPWSWF